jgi:tetratricopeptide (TPR) repeat protein
MGFLGDLEAAEESVAIARALDRKWFLAYSLTWQSQALRIASGDLHLARRSATEGARLAREIGSKWAVARSVLSQGQLAIVLGQFADARSYLLESLTLFSQSQDDYHANLARTELAHAERQQGNYDEALKLYQAAILVWQDLGLPAAVARQLECVALIAAAQGRLQHAVRLSGAAQKLREQTDTQPMPSEQSELDESLEALRRQLQDSVYNSLLEEGRIMTTSEAINYVVTLPTIQADFPENR